MSNENPHHPTPCDCEFCEIVRLRARVAELEAIVDRCAHDEWNRGFYGPARQFLRTI